MSINSPDCQPDNTFVQHFSYQTQQTSNPQWGYYGNPQPNNFGNGCFNGGYDPSSHRSDPMPNGYNNGYGYNQNPGNPMIPSFNLPGNSAPMNCPPFGGIPSYQQFMDPFQQNQQQTYDPSSLRNTGPTLAQQMAAVPNTTGQQANNNNPWATPQMNQQQNPWATPQMNQQQFNPTFGNQMGMNNNTFNLSSIVPTTKKSQQWEASPCCEQYSMPVANWNQFIPNNNNNGYFQPSYPQINYQFNNGQESWEDMAKRNWV